MNLKKGMRVRISNNITKSIVELDGLCEDDKLSPRKKLVGKLATIIEVEPPDVYLDIEGSNDKWWFVISDIQPLINTPTSKTKPITFDPNNLCIGTKQWN